MRPLVGLPSDTFEKDDLLFHSLGDKYCRAVAQVSDCLPVMIPSLDVDLDVDSLLQRIDGVVITGAVSNVHPPHYDEGPTPDHEPYDHQRDSTTLNLIKRVLDYELPLLCICRGFQELNVVFGGTLETEIQRGEARLDHRAPESEDLDVRYGPAHPLHLRRGGILHEILQADEIMVNTVHRQGIKRLGDGLEVEGTAPDGTIEAVSIAGANSFALGVQWHPEYKARDNPHSVKLFRAFGDAVRQHASHKSPPQRTGRTVIHQT